MTPIKVLLFSGWQDSCLVILKTLGRNPRYRFFIGDQWPLSAGRYSKHCSGFVRLGDYQEWKTHKRIIEFCRTTGVDVVLPLGHFEMIGSSRFKSEYLEAGVRLPVPDFDLIELANDKNRMADLAKKAGVPYPRTFLLENHSADDMLNRARMPLIAKQRNGTGQHGQKICRDEKTFRSHLRHMLRRYDRSNILVQEFIPGLEIDNMYTTGLLYDNEHRLKLVVPTKKVRSRPYTGGSGICVRAVKHRGVERTCVDIMNAFGRWVGISDVEVKEDLQTGVCYLIEINPRPWGGPMLGVISSGAPLIESWIKVALNEEVPPVEKLQEGIHTADVLSDFLLLTDLLKDLFKRSRRADVLRIMRTYRFPYFADGSGRRDDHLADVDVSDIKPFLFKLLRLRRSILHGLSPWNDHRRE